MLHAMAVDQLSRGPVPLAMPYENALSAALGVLLTIAGLRPHCFTAQRAACSRLAASSC
jgi:hypothetical protein